jgi:hypothetical protein
MNWCEGLMVGMVVFAAAVWITVAVYRWGQRAEARRWQPTPIKVMRIRNLETPPKAQPIVDKMQARFDEQEKRRRQFAAAQSPKINMEAIVQIESGGDPKAVSPAGCRGVCQIAEGTWIECCKWLGATWTWKEDAWDPGCNRVVGSYYMNVRIPAMLAHYGIEDAITTRLAAYNWGIGNLRRCWNQHGRDWLAYAPKETQRYILKYAEIAARQRAKGKP